MSEDEPGNNNLTSFPVLISVAVLVLTIVSGIVNYRQNNLADLESTLRDTREKLDLATKELSDTKLRAVIDFVYGERGRLIRHDQQQEDGVKDFASERDDLLMQLADAKDRVKDLEALAEEMSSDLDSKTDALEALKNKQDSKSGQAVAKISKSEATNTAVAKPGVTRLAVATAETAMPDISRPETVQVEETVKPADSKPAATDETNQDVAFTPLVANADVDIYQSGVDVATRERVDENIRKTGFKPKYPILPASMGLTNVSTIFFYHDSYKNIAYILAKDLNESIKQTILIKKGTSPYHKNKIVVHLIGK